VVLDPVRSNLGGSALAVDSEDRIHVAYYGDGVAKYVLNTGRRWLSPVVIESGNNVGRFPALALDGRDRAHLLYTDDDLFRTYYKYLGNEIGCRGFGALTPVGPF
jgi:hypothetical protein